jgi:ABC-2 type transport system permease protein
VPAVAVSTAAVAATRCPVDTIRLRLTGIQVGQAVVAILAVLAICGEYSTGLIHGRRPARCSTSP